MNAFGGKAAMFTQGALATLKKRADGSQSPMDDAGGVVVPAESPVTPSGESSKKKKKKQKKRNSKMNITDNDEVESAQAIASEATAVNGVAASADVADAVSSEPSPSPVEVAASAKEDPFSSSLLDLPSPVAAASRNGASSTFFDVFDSGANGASSVVVPPSTPAADAASGPLEMFDLKNPAPTSDSEPIPTAVASADIAPSPEPVSETLVVAPPSEPTPMPTPTPAPAPEPVEITETAATAPVFKDASALFMSPPPATAPVNEDALALEPEPVEITETTATAPVFKDAAALFVSPPPADAPVVEDVVAPPPPPPATMPVIEDVSGFFTTPPPAPIATDSMSAPSSPVAAPQQKPLIEHVKEDNVELHELPVDSVDVKPIESPSASGTVGEDAVATSAPSPEISIEENAFAEESKAAEDDLIFAEETDLVSAEEDAVDASEVGANDSSVVPQNETVVAEDATLPPSPTTVARPASLDLGIAIPPAAPVKKSPTPVSKAQVSKVNASTAAAAREKTSSGPIAAKPRPATVSRLSTSPAPKPSAQPTAKPTTASTSVPAPTAAAATRPSLQRALSGSAVTKKATKTPPKASAPSPPTRKSGSPTASATSPVAPDAEGKPKKKLSASEIDAVGNRLYEQAMESKRRLEARQAKLEDEFTFAPQVNAKSKKLDTKDAPDRHVMLHERAKEAQRKKEVLRERIAKEQCTFKPQITTKAKKIGSTTDRFDSLYKNAQEIQAKRGEKKKQELEKSEEDYTFKPKINTTKSPVKSRPLYDPEVVKQKRAELEQKKLEAEMQSKPKVIKKVKAEDGDSKIFDRLYKGGQQRAERLAKLKQDREDQEMATATFQPKLTATATNTRTSKQPFHTRLYDKDHLKKVAAEREQKKLDEEKQQFSFKPRVSNMPDSVKSKGSNESGSTGKSSIFERLYQDKDRVKEKIELSEELKIQKEMEECTFRPHIDVPPAGVSNSESSTPIWERLLSVDKNQIVEERERQKELQELESCTFRPEISGAPGSLSPKRASSSAIFDRLSTSGGTTPVDEKKHTGSERKPSTIGTVGKRGSYTERTSPKTRDPASAQRRALSVGDILKTSKLSASPERHMGSDLSTSHDVSNGNNAASLESQNESSTSSDAADAEPENVARSLEMELNEDDSLSTQSKSILENYDSWAAGLEEKMRNL